MINLPVLCVHYYTLYELFSNRESAQFEFGDDDSKEEYTLWSAELNIIIYSSLSYIYTWLNFWSLTNVLIAFINPYIITD